MTRTEASTSMTSTTTSASPRPFRILDLPFELQEMIMKDHLWRLSIDNSRNILQAIRSWSVYVVFHLVYRLELIIDLQNLHAFQSTAHLYYTVKQALRVIRYAIQAFENLKYLKFVYLVNGCRAPIPYDLISLREMLTTEWVLDVFHEMPQSKTCEQVFIVTLPHVQLPMCRIWFADEVIGTKSHGTWVMEEATEIFGGSQEAEEIEEKYRLTEMIDAAGLARRDSGND